MLEATGPLHGRVDFRVQALDLTLSPFFGQLRGFLKVDRKSASFDHSIHFEARLPFFS